MPRSAHSLRAAAATACLLQLTAACSSSADCEYLGSCVNSACACLPGWTGVSCGQLKLSTLSPSVSSGIVWPTPAFIPTAASSSWGFSPLLDDDGRYHAVVTVACNATGVLGDGGASSWLAHVSSTSLAGPYSFAAMFAPCVSFNPHVARSATGDVLVVFRVNNLTAELPLCVDGPPLPPWVVNASAIPASDLTPGDPELGTNVFIASAHSFAGPWSVTHITNISGSNYHNSNPSLTALSDGRTMMGFRYNPPGGERDAIAVSNASTGPFTLVAALSQDMKGNDEDPFVWQQPGDGSVHLLQHNGPAGWHWFAPSVEGPWARSPTGAQVYGNTANGTDGGSITFLRRERPEIVFDAQRVPLALITGVEAVVNGSDGAPLNVAYSFMHPVQP